MKRLHKILHQKYYILHQRLQQVNVGVPQGDCLSPILFTLYLADALKIERSTITEEHNYSKIPIHSEDLLQEHLKDHTYNLSKENGLLID